MLCADLLGQRSQPGLDLGSTTVLVSFDDVGEIAVRIAARVVDHAVE